ncbi:MAG TPA: SRPBCC family protein [Chthoniobacterales bacterium]|nr:SRPBCC family protein [Chthoniobacterales bacterium]
MRIREFKSELWLPHPREKIFAFFSDAANLNAITPQWLHFRMVTASPIQMRVGTLIDYRLRIRGIPVSWRTKITVWDPPFRFADEQLRGPYTFWQHQHEFESQDDGTLVRDKVNYAIPFDFIAHGLLVKRDVQRIFAHREERLRAIFLEK